MKKNYEFIIAKNKRNPNIDFIRIIGMFSIVIHHIILHGGAMNKYRKFKELELLNVLLMWHVSSFGIISGIIGNRSNKFSNLLYLWILVSFYAVLFYAIFNKLSVKTLIKILFPVTNKHYWYFCAYFGMYPFLPFINKGINFISQIEIKKIIYFMLTFFFILASFQPYTFGLEKGYCPFSLLIFYIFGAYLGKYIFYKIKLKIYRGLICLICHFIYIASSLICYNVRTNKNLINLDPKLKSLLSGGIFSFPMLCQIFSIIVFIEQINFNKYINNIITFLGPLTFDIYLIHDNQDVRRNYIANIFNNNPTNLNLIHVIILIIKKALFIFFFSIFIAYIRVLAFRILRIKNLCVLIESISEKFLTNLP